MAEDKKLRGKKRGGGINEKGRQQRVNKLAALGRASKAMQGLITPGVAADTQSVRDKLASKFPDRLRQVLCGRPGGTPLPPAVGAEVEDFVKQVNSFDSSAGAGPTGLRPQFVKELVGEGGEDPCVRCLFGLSMLFVEARVPHFLWQWNAGGTLVGIGKQIFAVPVDQDARPIVVGVF